MSEIKRVKISHVIEGQIPEFLNQESPLFEQFLFQYYQSQEHQSGSLDLANNIAEYRKITAFNNETLVPATVLTAEIFGADRVINVNSTVGWPDNYGLLKIDEEIITYTSKTATTFEGCARGFSGIDKISKEDAAEFLNFSETSATSHLAGAVVQNLSNLFLQQFFTKFKSEFLPGFENRSFVSGTSVANVLTRAKDFYTSKGTDASYQILFKLLYGKDIEIIKPIEKTLVASSNVYFKTKHVLVENLFGGDPTQTVGNPLLQNLPGIGTVSASIYNVEYRPVGQKDFYEISLDSTSFDGSFEVPGKTKTLEGIPEKSETIIVDSTVGFGRTGKLLIKPREGANFLLAEYKDKTLNQFLGVTGINTDLNFGADIFEDKLAFAYAGFGQTSLLQMRLVNVIDNVDTSETTNMEVGDSMKLYSFGFDLQDDPKFNSWIYNVPSTHNLISSQQVNVNSYRLRLYDSVVFYIGEELTLSDDLGSSVSVTVKNIEYDSANVQKKLSNRIVVQTNGVAPALPTKIQKKISKSSHNSNYFVGANAFPVGIQNSYLDNNEEFFYVASSGLPNYPIFATDNKIFVKTSTVEVTDGTGTPILGGGYTYTVRSLDPLNQTTPFKHNLVTGDKIYWDNTTYSGIQTGVYFVTSVNETEFLLSYSGSDVFSKKYVAIRTNTSGQDIYKSGWENKTLKNQKLLRKFTYTPKREYFDDPNKRTIKNRPVGLLANGVELFPATVLDEQIHFGDIADVKITNAGTGYDVLNGPPLQVFDQTGTGCVVHANVEGSFEEVKLISPGIGYQEKPKITVTGGNGSGAVLESNFVKGRIIANFKADGTSVNAFSDTIDFENKHNFELGEGVVYDSKGNPNIGNIVSGATYFVGPVSDKIIKLYTDPKDAISGINTVNIGGVSYGFHSLSTVESKNTITKIYVKNKGSGYSNKKILFPARKDTESIRSGVSTSDNFIFAKDHNFKDGEIVQYETDGTVISGLSTTTQYFVKYIDSDRFRLCDAGLGTSRTFDNYEKNRFSILKSVGTGKHCIKYPPIVVSVESISAIGATTVVKPEISSDILGSITSVYLEEGGIGYGCTNILDFHRRPDVGVSSTRFQALLQPIIIGGSIVDVQILASGDGFRVDSDIIINSPTGAFADIKPIVSNGKITGVSVLDGGVGYAASDTTLFLRNRGRDAKFIANVREWKINQVVKNENIIDPADSLLIKPSTNPEYQLQTYSMYPPNQLRYQLGDNIDSGNLELSANATHSPILGFAYDGNPIYGPYGFSESTGGPVVRLKSGYILDTANKVNLRPPGFQLGYFVNDFKFDNSGDLDEYGGRNCVTPQFPDGTYAYFYSIDVDSSGVADPKFPYILGSSFRDTPIEENFVTFFNQDVDIVSRNLTRNIGPYYLSAGNSKYELIDRVEDSYKQEFSVTKVKTAGITSVSVFARGSGYKVDDNLNLDNTGTDGTGANIVVGSVLGAEVNTIKIGVTTLTDVDLRLVNNKIIGVTTVPHEFSDGETIILSGISTSEFTQFNGEQKIKVKTRTTGLNVELADVGATGITTYISVTDTRDFVAGDVIGIGTETLTILNVDSEFGRFRVNREYYVGIGITHAVGTNNVFLKPNKFELVEDKDIKLSYLTYTNQMLFFDPTFTVGMGSTGTHYDISLTGLGLSAANETIENRFVPQRQLYIPNHKFYTGQSLVYHMGVGGTSLTYAKTAVGSTSGVGTERLESGETYYAVNFGNDYLGISTVGFPTAADAVWWYSVASNIGAAHSVATNFPKVTAVAEKYFGQVTTKTNHNLSTKDEIKLTAIPTQTETVELRFDPVIAKVTTKKVAFDQTSFTADLTGFKINDTSYNTGDKVVFYVDNTNITGLVHNETYFVLRESPEYIKLCKHKADVDSGTIVNITNVPTGNYYLARVNPPFDFVRGDRVTFDVSDVSLRNMELRFFEDIDFVKDIETSGNVNQGFNIKRNAVTGNTGATVEITTSTDFPRKCYYQVIPVVPSDERKLNISSDKEVKGRNNITLNKIVLDNEHTIVKVDDTTFNFNLKSKPSEPQMFVSLAGVSTITYETSSRSAVGPIAKLKVNFPGKGYRRLPRVVDFDTASGVDGVAKIFSEEVGEIDTLERVKDGFDYPTDPTLLPFLNVPAIVDVNGIARIDEVRVTDGGKNYTQPPNLAIRGNDTAKLAAHVSGGSVSRVDVVANAFEFYEPLSIITTNNSNGYDIDQITHSGTDVTVELLLDPQFNIPIRTGYGSTDIELPFAIGDRVFIEGCRLKPDSFAAGEQNFNSDLYDYNFFTVTGVNTANFTVTYSMANAPGITTAPLGSYDDDFTLGYIVNYNDMAKFSMKLIDDAKYLSGEKVTSNKFEGYVAENGWNGEISQLRLRDTIGTLREGDTLVGEVSELKGNVRYVSRFSVKTRLGVTRDKIEKNDLETGILNDFSQRISDNFYYQKFSYSVKSNLDYNTWKESVRSILHPSGFREFSDFQLESDPKKDAETFDLVSVGVAKSTNMAVKPVDTKVDLIVNVDNEIFMGTRENFAMVTEDDALTDGTVQRIFFPEGRPIKSYILNKTNKVLNIDDISTGFNGAHDRTGTLVGSTQFKLKSKGSPIFRVSFASSNPNVVDLTNNIINLPNHNFQTGQELIYDKQGGDGIGIGTTDQIVGTKDIIMTAVTSGVGGSAMFENGYNVEIPEGGVTGTSLTSGFPIVTFKVFGFGMAEGGIPGISTRGTGARFQVKFTYDGQGSTLSTNVVLTKGGNGYFVGDTVSIGGTWLGGASPANDLSFPVTRVTGTRTGIQSTYTNVPSTNNNAGTGAIFNITRDSNLDVVDVEVVQGGSGYAHTDVISIAGTYIGGATPTDDIFLTPIQLGGTTMPDLVYVNKVDDFNFKLCGIPTGLPLNFTGFGTGNHVLRYSNPNLNALIMIDNIIQTPIKNKKLSIGIGSNLGPSDQSISITSGIGSIAKNDIIKIDDEMVKVKSIGDTTFVQSRFAIAETTVDNNFYFDVKRMNSDVTTVDETFPTHDDNPPY